MRRDDLRKKFPRPPDLDDERQSTGIGTGHEVTVTVFRPKRESSYNSTVAA
jgi:hypothetical protein